MVRVGMHWLLAAAAALLLAMPSQAQVCSVTCNLTGAVNDYWPGTAGAAAGATSITLGARRTGTGTAGNAIAIGDWVIVLQVQDATINTSTGTSAYGANNATGAGYLAANQTGFYEFKRATSAVGAAGGALTVSGGLLNTYNVTPVAGAQTTPRFQVIRVPNCVTANLSGSLSGAPWNGTTGGVIALRGETVNGGGATIDATGIGFRGGATDAHNGPNDTNSYASTNQNDQYKGEGIAATPDYIYDTATAAEIATGQTMPNGYRGRGAAGNAGGAGEGDSGAGGGGNGGAGGRGGTWDTGTIGNNGGGRGGAVFAEAAFGRLVLGGGGGGGSANTGATTANEATIPYGTGANSFNRGGAGGGLVILGGVTRAGSFTINANGAGATGTTYTSTTQGSRVGGGGGAGGSIVLFGSGGAITASATGGNGYNDQLATGHIAHGGGGGGGVVLAAGSLAGVASTVTGGNAGCTTSGVNDTGATACGTGGPSSTNGAAGSAATFSAASVEPGTPTCGPANIAITKTNNVATVNSGSTTTYTITVSNSGPTNAPNSLVRDPAATGLNCSTVTFAANPVGGVVAGPLSIAGLQGAGIALTTFNANSTATFTLTCGVTATGF